MEEKRYSRKLSHKEGFIKIKDKATGKIFTDLADLPHYLGMKHWTVYWRDASSPPTLVWTVPVFFSYLGLKKNILSEYGEKKRNQRRG